MIQNINKENIKISVLVKNLMLMILATIGFISCDPSTGEAYYLTNQSDYTVTVRFNDMIEDDKKMEVLSNATELIFEYFDTGATTDLGDNFLRFFDTIYVTINDTVELIKDVNKRNNWEFEIRDDSGFGNAGIGTYTFIISNNDLGKID